MKTNVLLAVGMCLLILGTAQAKDGVSYRPTDSVHSDGRGTPRLQFDPEFAAPRNLAGEELVRQFLRDRAADYGIAADLSNLQLQDIKESLVGSHYTFQQVHEGTPLADAQIIVSVARETGRVYRVFNNIYPEPVLAPTDGMPIAESRAYDLAWSALGVRGKLLGQPSSKLLWTRVGKGFRLVRRMELFVEDPHGAWRIDVDAQSGEVVAKENRLLPRAKHEAAPQKRASTGPLLDRSKAFADFEQANASPRGFGVRANGTGLVFDPDPRTTLQDDSLQDNSPAASFDAAYFTRSLLDISLVEGVYKLIGPWVQIVDFESPTNAPSTTTDGNWTAKRGDNAFNDAMTYFHIDQNQRYMQSLGFFGEKAIQGGSIQIDSDGFGGSDNSYFSPTANRIAFGHGCVDDNEDADVILHEYGHAIQHSIVPNWGGGDSGAIGEGFGDYWAASYSISTPNGMSFNKNHVFSWDGHGAGNKCWPGRVLDAVGAKYNPNTSYGAHHGIPGGYQSDELWSTPLFQALLAILEAGYTREQADRIILEAHFGLGSGVTMPEMANAIMATAQALEADEAVSTAFLQNFLRHEILQVPAPALQAQEVEVSDSGANGAIDPGERVEIRIPIKNAGTAAATAVRATLASPTDGVRVVQGESTYSDLGINGIKANDTPFVIEVAPDFACGADIELALEIGYGKSRQSVSFTYEIGSGKALSTELSAAPELAIPDNDATGVSSEIRLAADGKITNGISVALDLTHTYVGDLRISLESPAGTRVMLHDKTGGSSDNLIGIYPETLTPGESLSKLDGESLSGNWKLTVIDTASSDKGTLHKWGVRAVTGYECQ